MTSCCSERLRALPGAAGAAPRVGSLTRLEPDVLELGRVLAVRVGQHLDVGLDLVRDLVGELRERLGLLWLVVSRPGSGCECLG